MTVSDTQTVFSGSTIEDLINLVERSSHLPSTAKRSAALHESDGQRQSALADGSKPIRLTGIDCVRGVPQADIAGKEAGEMGFPALPQVTTHRRTNQTPASPNRPADFGSLLSEMSGAEQQSADATNHSPVVASFLCPDCHAGCDRLYSCATNACKYLGCSGCFVRHQSIYGVRA